MERVQDFFATAKEQGIKGGELEAAFPTLSTDEEKEVLQSLGVNSSKQTEHAKDVIFGTLRNVKQLKIQSAESETPLNTSSTSVDHESSSEEEFFGTVRIKTGGAEKFGTIRFNPLQLDDTEPIGTVVFHGDAGFGELDCDGSVRIVNSGNEETKKGADGLASLFAPRTDSTPSEPAKEAPTQLFWRAPDDWELNIIALERGEWTESMNDDAFRKYKKERPKLSTLNNMFIVQDTDTVVEKENAIIVEQIEPKKPRRKKEKKDKKEKIDKKKSKKSLKKDSKPELKDSPTKPKERKWSLFRKAAEEKNQEREEMYSED